MVFGAGLPLVIMLVQWDQEISYITTLWSQVIVLHYLMCLWVFNQLIKGILHFE